MQAIRTMAPQILAVDEIGGKKDLESLVYAMQLWGGRPCDHACRKPFGVSAEKRVGAAFGKMSFPASALDRQKVRQTAVFLI